jgi:TatD DNase family protein
MRLIDSHAHLQSTAFALDATEVIAAARLAGVERILAPAWDRSSTEAGVVMARERPGVDTSAGIHPHEAAKVTDDDWAVIVALASEPEVVAIGETGLDYDRGFASRDAQLANLSRHLELALAVGKPVILHCRSRPGERDAQDDLLGELRNAGVASSPWSAAFEGRPVAILHSFSGPVDYGVAAVELGLAVSFSGLVFRHGEESSGEVARLVPADRLLVETDSPYLPPPGAPRRRNEPLWVEVTARWVAERRGERPEDLGEGLVAAYDGTLSRATKASSPEGSSSR